ncbi:unnamed protein product, partial [Ectocarpus sp. 12 AP-2014]
SCSPVGCCNRWLAGWQTAWLCVDYTRRSLLPFAVTKSMPDWLHRVFISSALTRIMANGKEEKVVAEGRALLSVTPEVFYSDHQQVLQRDLSVAVLRAYRRQFALEGSLRPAPKGRHPSPAATADNNSSSNHGNNDDDHHHNDN